MLGRPNLYSPKRCLVLGGCGFLGSHLVDSLASSGHFVRSFDRPGISQPEPLKPLENCGEIQVVSGDFSSAADLEKALDGIDICYHLVSTTIASTSNRNPSFDVESNLLGTLRLLDIAVKKKVKRLVYVSSGGTVYGLPTSVPIAETHKTDPTSSYGITKLAIEKYLHLYQLLHGLDSVVLRLANPYGERQKTNAEQGVVAVFLGHVIRHEEIAIWGDGSVVRDFLHVSDVADALMRAGGHLKDDKRVLNIGSGRGYSINQILDTIESVTGRNVARNYSPARVFDVPVNVLDISAAAHTLGWKPRVSLEEGIQRFFDWIAQSSRGL